MEKRWKEKNVDKKIRLPYNSKPSIKKIKKPVGVFANRFFNSFLGVILLSTIFKITTS